MRFMTQYVRWVNGRDGGGRAHGLTHKLVKNGQSLKCHHVKRLSPTRFIFHTHCNEWYNKYNNNN